MVLAGQLQAQQQISPHLLQPALRLLRLIAGKNCLRSRNKMKVLCLSSLACPSTASIINAAFNAP